MIRAVFLLSLVVMLIWAARTFMPEEDTSLVGSGATLAFGFVLLAALQMGTLFSGVKMPKLTGYLACGFIAGPSVLNLVTQRMVSDLTLVNGVAIGLIALSAGGELNFKKLRGRLGSILMTGGFALLSAIVILSIAVFTLAPFLPFMKDFTFAQRGVIALTMAVSFAAMSPTVTLALISETGSAGPISETSLGIVVLGDLVIVFAFAAARALAGATFGGEGGGTAELAIHIFGSMGAGLILGLVLLLYLKKVNQRVALFVVGICFLCAEAGSRLHLDPLLMCLTAGLFLENLTDIEGSKLVHEIEPAVMPVFAVFFAVAGAGLHWSTFKVLAPIAIALAVIRAAALWLGGRIGMATSGVPKAERQYLHFALYSQSGVAIALATLLKQYFPGWGNGAGDCILGGVMVNEMVGPVLFKAALVRSGEAGKRVARAGAH